MRAQSAWLARLAWGECGLNLNRDRQRQPHRVALTGGCNEHDSARALLQLISWNRAGLPVDRFAKPLRSSARAPRLHLIVHINVTVPAAHDPVDHDRRMNIEGAERGEQEPGHACLYGKKGKLLLTGEDERPKAPAR